MVLLLLKLLVGERHRVGDGASLDLTVGRGTQTKASSYLRHLCNWFLTHSQTLALGSRDSDRVCDCPTRAPSGPINYLQIWNTHGHRDGGRTCGTLTDTGHSQE